MILIIFHLNAYSVAFSGVKLSGNAGLEIKDDSLIIVNNDFKITLEEIILSVSILLLK